MSGGAGAGADAVRAAEVAGKGVDEAEAVTEVAVAGNADATGGSAGGVTRVGVVDAAEPGESSAFPHPAASRTSTSRWTVVTGRAACIRSVSVTGAARPLKRHVTRPCRPARTPRS
jgi:hypothetical protein